MLKPTCMVHLSENEPFLDAMGYDPEDPGEDVTPPAWAPDRTELTEYLRRDAELALGNVALATARSYVRERIVITNGCDPGHGYGSIAVIVGGPDPEDCLHSLSAFGRARAVVASSLAMPVVDEPSQARAGPKAA